jgi:hypothetical protein
LRAAHAARFPSFTKWKGGFAARAIVVHAVGPEGHLQNENPNPAHADARETVTLQAARKLDLEARELAQDERKRWEEAHQEDPERWDGMS